LGGGRRESPVKHRAGGGQHGPGGGTRAGQGRAGEGKGGPASNQTKIQFKKKNIFIIEHIIKKIIFLKTKKKINT